MARTMTQGTARAPSSAATWCSRECVWAACRRHAKWIPLGSVVLACLGHGIGLRLLAIAAVFDKWANANQRMLLHAAAGLAVGAVQDVCVCACMCASLWCVEQMVMTLTRLRQLPAAATATSSRRRRPNEKRSSVLRGLLVATHFVVCNALFCTDLVVLRARQMRFRWELVALAWRERHSNAWTQFQVDEHEVALATRMALVTLAVATALGCVASTWLHPPSEWDRQLWRASASARSALTHAKCSHLETAFAPTRAHRFAPLQSSSRDDERSGEEPADEEHLAEQAENRTEERTASAGAVHAGADSHVRNLAVRSAWWILLVLILALLAVATSKCVPSVVAMIAWNASFAEPLRALLGVECVHTRSLRIARRVSELVDAETEQCAFANPNALVRTTRGFRGPLAFDIAIKPTEKPNVLVVVVESFRQRDSRYLLGAQHAAALLPPNVTLTPQFDAWAARGVAFSNMWSTWRTSRSLEQILFGQLPLDSATDSGTSMGHTDIKLSGLPQLMRAKGYETVFTSGARLDYDEWEVFLPSHGFDQVLDGWDLAEMGLNEMGIDWTMGDRVMAYWGVHDDLTFDVLAHMLKGKRQKQKRASNATEPAAKPWFLTHYTISSHVPFDERPDWYFRLRERDLLPDFSAMSASIDDPETQELVQNYAEMRFFTDLVFGRFMSELEASGVLNDTIVVVTSDHGQAPERGTAMPEDDQVSAMKIPGLIIAEGRLGHHAGTVIDGVTAQYDWLNTIADIVGVPETGFLQTGVGRSLKRQPPDDRRVVYSNNPALNLAAVQAHTRIEFYADVMDVVRVFNVERDPSRSLDLVGQGIPAARMHEILTICDEARVLNAYFKHRWDHKCLLEPTCSSANHGHSEKR